MKEEHYKLSDSEFERLFESCELDPQVFSHEAHLRLAWIHINKYGEDQALENIEKQLYDYANSLGETEKYNKTLTIAAVKAVNHFMLKAQADSFSGFISEFPGLKHNFRELIAQHYSSDIFNSGDAKVAYLEPDLVPFN